MKRFTLFTISFFLLLLAFPFCNACSGQDDVADIPAKKLSIKVEKSETFYYLIGEAKKKSPRKGQGLAIILPGGGGRADQFLGFIKRIYKLVLRDRKYLVALPDASHGNPNVVWPTGKSKVNNLKYTTEEYVSAVLKDVKKRCKIDPKKIVLMAWSSGGPAAYAISLSQKEIRGFYILMSVYWKFSASERKLAKGKVYFLEHSPEDKICPFEHTGKARKELEKSGAKVNIVEYKGGHGFHGPIYPRMKAAFDWLEKELKKKRRGR